MKCQWRAIAFFVAMLFIFDVAYSLLATCTPPYSQAAYYSSQQNHCSAFAGIFPQVSIAFLLQLLDLLKFYEHELVAGFTIVLAISTIGLWISTRALWKAGDDQIAVAKISANAAKSSADAAVAVERARFFAVIDHNFLKCVNAAKCWGGPANQEDRPLPVDEMPMAGIQFKNYGKTPGIVSEVHTGIFLSERAIDPVYDGKVVKDNIIVSGDFTEVFGTIIDRPITMAQAIKIECGAIYLWVFGRIIYDDVFGNTQTHNFLQRFVCVSQLRYVLQSYDYKHYNKST